MPLITAPVPPSIAPNVTSEIYDASGNYSLGAGGTLYATTLNFLFYRYHYEGTGTFNNAGTIWNDFSAESYVLSAGNWDSLNNSGTIVAHSTGSEANTFLISANMSGGIFNSGSIYALSDAQNATAIEHWSGTETTIENSGTIAARGANWAWAIYAFNGSEIHNSASGSILAEGANARAITLGAGHFQAAGQPPSGVDITNYGLIEARSTDPTKASVAVYVFHTEGQSMVIDNHGVIRGDFAIYSNPWAFSPQQHSSDWVTNHAGALIEGEIFLDLGDDHIVNEGQITGYVDMGEGDDLFDNQLGQHAGNSEMGWGNDIYLGGNGFEAVTGNRGDDQLSGGGGNDLILAGWGNDVLQGDSGNDALYGEGGNDRVVTSGGDRVEAGAGNDRVELGDYRFASVSGGDGHDILVLPADSRILDLGQVAGSGRVSGFEELLLSNNGRLVVHAADVAGISGGSSLRISAVGAGTVDLAGSWTAGAIQLIGGTSYTTYASGSTQLLVQQGLAVNLGSSPAGATGLDAVADGSAAPLPGSVPGADLTSNITMSEGFLLTSDVEIDIAETWISDSGVTVIWGAESDVSLVNRGILESIGGINGANGISGSFLNLHNYGTIAVSAVTGTDQLSVNINHLQTYGISNSAVSLSGNVIGAYFGTGGAWNFLNAGEITVSSVQSIATGYLTYLRPGENQGTISASSSHFVAVGAYLHNGGQFINSGTIEATGAWGAYGVGSTTHGLNLINSGTIRADATGAGREGIAVDIYYASGTQFITNSGLIEGDVAIRTSGMVNGNMLWLENSGQITGRIELGLPVGISMLPRDDVIINDGAITGSVSLGAGRDVYDGTDGTQVGTVYGQDGADLLIGTAVADTLDGGAGDDVFLARGGDRLTGGSGSDRFVFTAVTPGAQAEVITDFVSGTDRIDLRTIAPTSVTINGSTITAVTAAGTLTIQVTGSVTLADIVTGATTDLAGTTGDDVLVAGPGGAVLSAGDGFDLLVGGIGNDRLDGGFGGNLSFGETADIMWGGDGNDTYIVDSRDDRVFEDSDGGYDTVEITTGLYALSYEMPDHVERVIGGSALGNELDNVMIGNSSSNGYNGGGGADLIGGGAGDDTLGGGLGIDTLTGGAGADTFGDTAAGLNGDTITDFGLGDRINITDVHVADFAYSLTGNVLTFTGGSLSLGTVPVRQIEVRAVPGGGGVGVELYLHPHDPNNDFNGDGRSDILWTSDSGQVSNWLGQLNGGFVVNDAVALNAQPANAVVTATGDFNGDGRDDVLWRGGDGWLSLWNSSQTGGWPSFYDPYAGAGQTSGPPRVDVAQVPLSWQIAGTGDFNGDGRDDILWRSESGQLSDWLGAANGGFANNDANAFVSVSTDWQVVGTGDFNGDGWDDILWRSDSGQLSDWLGTANGGFANNDANAFVHVPSDWHVVGTGDFNGDGRDDILWRSDSGALSNWLGTASGGFANNDANALIAVPTDWHVAGVGDFNGDGRDDILWRSDGGALSNWLGTASGGFVNNDANAFGGAPTSWHVQPEDYWF